LSVNEVQDADGSRSSSITTLKSDRKRSLPPAGEIPVEPGINREIFALGIVGRR
jgi:hypothetical protein